MKNCRWDGFKFDLVFNGLTTPDIRKDQVALAISRVTGYCDRTHVLPCVYTAEQMSDFDTAARLPVQIANILFE